MKKILFTTTALVAGAMISSAAMADGMNSYRSSSMKSSSMSSSSAMQSSRYLQQNDMMGSSAFKATLGGYANWMVGYADNDFKDQLGMNEFDVMGDAEVHFNFEAALKNGMKVGYTAQIETDTSDTSNDLLQDTYMWVESSYGKVMVGRHPNVNEQLALHAIDLGPLDIQETDFNRWVINPTTLMLSTAFPVGMNALISEVNTTNISVDKLLTKISYVTPNFNGFQAGLTYAPRGNKFKDDVTHPVEPDPADPLDPPLYSSSDATVLTAAYNGEMNGFGFGVSAGYGFNTVDGVPPSGGMVQDTVTRWNIGGRVAYQGFTLSAAYKNADLDIAGDSSDLDVWDVGLTYETGPYGVSLSYIETTLDVLSYEVGNNKTLLLSGVYNMAAGVDAFATFGWGDYKLDLGGDSMGNDGFALVTGMMLSF